MNGEDQFEKRLQRERQRPIPPSWRAEILRAASEAAACSGAPRSSTPSQTPSATSWLLTLLWPHPRAWAGLAAAWVLIVGLNLTSREAAQEQLASRPVPTSPQKSQLLREQEQLFAELLGPLGRADADRAKPTSPKPRSDARHEITMV